MLSESHSWQLPRKCRCLVTAGKESINFDHTSSISYDSSKFDAKEDCLSIYVNMYTEGYKYPLWVLYSCGHGGTERKLILDQVIC